jgi:hypothetical protein
MGKMKMAPINIVNVLKTVLAEFPYKAGQSSFGGNALFASIFSSSDDTPKCYLNYYL